jgi:hypothetical protein
MAVFTRVKTWVSNEVLTASDLNGEINNLLTNTKPESIEDYSADVSTMQSTTSPGGVGTESLATTLAGEIQRLRYKIKEIIGGAQWYSAVAIPTANIADLAVTRAKMEAVGQQLSASSGVYQSTSTSRSAVTNLSVTITSTGRPIRVMLVPDGSANSALLNYARSSNAANIDIFVLRDSTDVYSKRDSVTMTGATLVTASATVPDFLDIVAAGTYTYTVEVIILTSGNTPLINCNYFKLLAYEL